MKKIFVLLGLMAVLNPVFGQEEYTLFCGGDTQGTVTIQKDMAGKITITPQLNARGYITIDHNICPLIPAQKKFYIGQAFGSFSFYAESGGSGHSVECVDILGDTLHVDPSATKVVIDGTTTEIMFPDDEWIREVISGNTRMVTTSGGYWQELVASGDTTTVTDSDGDWTKMVVSGNTKIITSSRAVGHSWTRIVVSGNTTTWTNSNGDWEKEVISGNTRTWTTSDDWRTETKIVGNTTTETHFQALVSGGNRLSYSLITTVDKQGHNIFIEQKTVKY